MKLLEPKVSVVIPSFNKGKMVLATLESVFNSDYAGEIEVVLVDDKSTDPKTLTAYEKAKNNYRDLKFFINDKKPAKVFGPAYARNLGLSKSTGEFVIFLDSDDLLSENFINNLVHFAKAHEKADFFYSDMILFDQSENLRLRRPPKFSLDKLKIYNYIPVTCLYKKQILEKIGGFDTSILSMEDWELILRLSLAGYIGAKIGAIDTFLYYRQNSPGSVNSTAFSIKKRIFVRNQIQRKNKVYTLASPFWNLAAVFFSLLSAGTAKRETANFEKLPQSVKEIAKETVKRAISSGK